MAHYTVDMNVPNRVRGRPLHARRHCCWDAEGIVVVPQQVAADIVDDAVEQELVEDFALARVSDGETIRGLYPLSADRKDEYATCAIRPAHPDVTEACLTTLQPEVEHRYINVSRERRLLTVIHANDLDLPLKCSARDIEARDISKQECVPDA